MGQRKHFANIVGLYRSDGWRRTEGSDGVCDSQRKLHRQTFGEFFSGALQREKRFRGPRMHPGPAASEECDGGGCREAIDGFWISCADHFMASAGNDDGGTNR